MFHELDSGHRLDSDHRLESDHELPSRPHPHRRGIIGITPEVFRGTVDRRGPAYRFEPGYRLEADYRIDEAHDALEGAVAAARSQHRPV